MRAALYARFSSDRQNPLSITDQLAALRRHCEARGWTAVAAYEDAAISGSAMANRPGLLSALAAGGRGEFDILLAEDEDRIARNLGHLAMIRDDLALAGVTLATLATDVVDTMHVAFKGLIAESYIKALSQKTSRGMRANAERGQATGSKLYGYDTASGGAIAINEAEAEVIRRIFTEYAAGRSGKEIAARLNREGILTPRGGQWHPATITGSQVRGNGILRSEIYAGVKVWNRMLVLKDHRTGRKTLKIRPHAEWKRTAVPHLRIVDDALWAEAQARLVSTRDAPMTERRRRTPSLFSGLMKCGQCGANYIVMRERSKSVV